MGGLQNFERRLENVISGVFARAFRSAVQPVEIVAALQREVDNNTQILSRDRRLAPNDFRVELSPGDMERLSPYDSTLERELTEQLREHAEQQAYVFPGPIRITFEESENLTTGRFNVTSRARAGVQGRPEEPTPSRPGRGTPRITVEVNGSRHTITATGLVVGRGTEADLRISDPGVSRRHVRFTLSGGGVEVRDLGSTNGMSVDGHRVDRMAVRNGSVVKIGNTTMTVHMEGEQ